MVRKKIRTGDKYQLNIVVIISRYIQLLNHDAVPEANIMLYAKYTLIKK